MRRAGGEEPARGVRAHRIQQVVQGHEGSGALGHGNLDAVQHEADPADQQHLEVLPVVAHRLGGVAVAGDRPVVVHAPDVDQVVEAAAELLGDIPDVGREVRRPSVGAVDHAILVVAEGRRAKPQGPVLLVHVPGVPQPVNRPRDPALVVQGRLALPDVEPDPEPGERCLDHRPDPRRRPPAHDIGGVRVRCAGIGPDVVRDGVRQVSHIGTPVPVFGHGLAASHGRHRGAQVLDLRARVVEVVLPGDGLPACLEHPAQQVPDEGATRVADRERPGRVGRHELHVDPAGVDGRDAAPGRGRGQDPADHAGEGRIRDPQVEEAGACHVHGSDQRGGRSLPQ